MNFFISRRYCGKSRKKYCHRKTSFTCSISQIDFVVANGENSAGGYGITQAICEDLFKCGVDVITSGNHIWDQKRQWILLERKIDC